MALLTAVLLTTDLLEWWHLVPISLVTGTMFALHNPASQAYAVDVVGRDRLDAASDTAWTYSKGGFRLPDRPGIGVEIDESLLDQFIVDK